MFTEEDLNSPDNSLTECNIVVKNLDTSFNSQDLYKYFFDQYGPIKSAKVSLFPNH
jgi:RNA recognition motif-containing protein